MKLRRRAVLKWTGSALCGLIVLSWFVGRWFQVSLCWRRANRMDALGCGNGRMFWLSARGFLPDSIPVGWSVRGVRHVSLAVGWSWQITHMPPATPQAGAELTSIPLYVPFALLAGPVALAVYRGVRRGRGALEGRCDDCGYDLAGLTGPCPECGKEGSS